jgi:enoyl-CoA hydratase/carnithine racemase
MHTFLFSEDGRIAIITLNNPAKLNALTGKVPVLSHGND